jgi:hypothetical protein
MPTLADAASGRDRDPKPTKPPVRANDYSVKD